MQTGRGKPGHPFHRTLSGLRMFLNNRQHEVKTMCSIYTYARYARDELAIDVREVIQAIAFDERDFEVDRHRFIHEDDIDEIMRDELASDEYLLGCASAWFLADILGCPTEAIEKMQEAEAFEAIGCWVLDGHLDEFQQGCVSHDGYGHHFNSWDGSEDQVGDYYVFRN